jgi:hypothetical protein
MRAAARERTGGKHAAAAAARGETRARASAAPGAAPAAAPEGRREAPASLRVGGADSKAGGRRGVAPAPAATPRAAAASVTAAAAAATAAPPAHAAPAMPALTRVSSAGGVRPRAASPPPKRAPSPSPPPPPPPLPQPSPRQPPKRPPLPLPLPPLPLPAAPGESGYLSGSDTDSGSGSDWSSDADTDDEGASSSASAFASARSSAPPAFYTARFTTQASLPPGAVPFVLCGHACFGAAGALALSRRSGSGSGDRWELCVAVPTGTALSFRLALVTCPGGALAPEAGPARALRARSRAADVAVRCAWGDASSTRVQVAYGHVSFFAPACTLPFGRTLAVSGAAAALGRWAAAGALPLAWAGPSNDTGGGASASSGDAWRSAPVRLPVGEPHAWRLAVRHADGRLEVEPGPARSLTLRRGGGGAVTVRWGELSAQAQQPPSARASLGGSGSASYSSGSDSDGGGSASDSDGECEFGVSSGGGGASSGASSADVACVRARRSRRAPNLEEALLGPLVPLLQARPAREHACARMLAFARVHVVAFVRVRAPRLMRAPAPACVCVRRRRWAKARR